MAARRVTEEFNVEAVTWATERRRPVAEIATGLGPARIARTAVSGNLGGDRTIAWVATDTGCQKKKSEKKMRRKVVEYCDLPC